MEFLKLRITLGEVNEPLSEDFRGIYGFLNAWAKDQGINKYTMGLEHKNKLGEPTHPHIHFHGFYLEDDDRKKNTIQKNLKRSFYKRFGVDIKGASGKYSYVLMLEKTNDEEDIRKILQYPLKQYEIKINKHFYLGISGEEIEEMREDAHAQWKVHCDLNRQHRDNTLEKMSFKSKCFGVLYEQGVRTHKDFIINFIQYYLDKQKTPPFSKMEDCFIEYKMINKLMSIEEYYNLTYKYNGS